MWKPFLDWIGISVDSLNEETNIKMGRAIAGTRPLNQQYYTQIVQLINEFEFKLKINTVVNQFNKNEDLTDFIENSKTGRWKIFQVLPIKGENDKHIDNLKINNHEFESFLLRHQMVSEVIVAENNHKMLGSYAMVDPAGRFFENSAGYLSYSEPILKVGVNKAYLQAHPSRYKFLVRGGKYDW
jgi:radical S-adenosyl methionine domain-containing protein 2